MSQYLLRHNANTLEHLILTQLIVGHLILAHLILGHLILRHLILGYLVITDLILRHNTNTPNPGTPNLWDTWHCPRKCELKSHVSNSRNEFLRLIRSPPFHTNHATFMPKKSPHQAEEIPPSSQHPLALYWLASANGMTHKTHKKKNYRKRNIPRFFMIIPTYL